MGSHHVPAIQQFLDAQEGDELTWGEIHTHTRWLGTQAANYASVLPVELWMSMLTIYCYPGAGEDNGVEQGGLADVTHPFHYSECWLNLPAATNYDPLMPWIMLLQQDGELANRKVTFVDDIHGIRHGKQVEDQCVKEPPQVLAFRMNHKGNQCAGRNFGLPTLSPHP